MSFIARKFEIALAAAGDDFLIDEAALGYDPKDGIQRFQISSNECGGTFKVELKPVGASNFVDTFEDATAGQDVVVGGRDDDPFYESIKVTFAGTTSDIELYYAAIK
tara:strand:+ start:221 stop:541 length:321 start_codon:yes stop_codon:yes gene_type:complete